MASTSLKKRLQAMSNNADSRELRPLLEAILTDLTALKNAVDTIATKLNADAGVTDTNYAGAATLTLTS